MEHGRQQGQTVERMREGEDTDLDEQHDGLPRDAAFGLLLGEDELAILLGGLLVHGALDCGDLVGDLGLGLVGFLLDEQLGVLLERLADGALGLDATVVCARNERVSDAKDKESGMGRGCTEGDQELSDRLGHVNVMGDEDDSSVLDEVTAEALLDDPSCGLNVEAGRAKGESDGLVKRRE